MKVVLVGPELEENLALRYLCSSIRKAGHECTIVPFNRSVDLRRAGRAVLRERPGLVGISLVAQRRYRDVQDLIAMLRSAGYHGHITAGGHFASLRAPEVLRDTSGLDSVLHHDAEERIVSLVRLIDPGDGNPIDGRFMPDRGGDGDGRRARGLLAELPPDFDGISWRTPDGAIRHRRAVRVPVLDSLPFPTRRRPDRAIGYARAPIVSSRGCAGSCSFCSIHAWQKQVPTGRLRFRSPDNVADEMIALHREERVRVFIFHDDDFIHPDRREASQRCRRILDTAQRGIGEPFAFVIKCRPDDVDEDLFAYLKAMGLVRAYVGIETSSAAGIVALNRRVTPETNARALAILGRLGVYACFNLLLFHPETTIEELRENLDFLTRHLGQPFDVARTELYAQSPLEERMIHEGRAIGDYRGYGYRISDPQAEGVFRLFADLLWDRHFGRVSILHRVQDLGLRLSLLRRFHPDSAQADLAARVDSLIRDVNAATVDYFQRFIAIAVVEGPVRDSMIAETRRHLRDDLRRQWARFAVVSVEIDARAILGRSSLSTISSAARLPQMVGRVAAIPGLTVILGSIACSSCTNGPDICDPPPPPQQYSRDIQPKLESSCAITGCHTTEAAQAGLVLQTGASRANLVDVPSTELPGMKRVAPGLADSSYIVHKLQGTQATVGGSGERMPKDSPPDEDLAWRMQIWIDDGAKDD